MFRLFSRTGLGVLASAWLWTTPAAAQTRLAWPSGTVDISRYSTVEECLAVTDRVRDSLEVPRRLEMVIAPLDRATAFQLPAGSVHVAQTCSARWNANDVSLDDFSLLLDLYLRASRDADARLLISRRLSSASSLDDSSKFAILDTIAATYLFARPARLDDADSALILLARIPKTTARLFLRIKYLGVLNRTADMMGDTMHARRSAETIAQLASAFTTEEKSSWEWANGGKQVVYQAYDYLTWLTQLDSLRRNVTAYTTLIRANWTKASDERSESMEFPIGSRAQPLASEFWFAPRGTALPAGSSSTPVSSATGGASGLHSMASAAPSPPRPTAGQISMVIFLVDCHQRVFQCWDTYATIKRIHQQFPQIEFTLTAQTFGFFLEQVPPPPDIEANLYRQWWLDFHRVPAMLAISETSNWRLPDPDRRRINEPVANRMNYSFGEWGIQPQTAFLIDRSGTILYSAPLGRYTERRFQALLQVLSPNTAMAR